MPMPSQPSAKFSIFNLGVHYWMNACIAYKAVWDLAALFFAICVLCITYKTLENSFLLFKFRRNHTLNAKSVIIIEESKIDSSRRNRLLYKNRFIVFWILIFGKMLSSF